MATAERILTEEMVAAIREYFPRYPTRQAVTLPALHIVNERLRYVPLEAVVEIAELLELAPAQVQDTLSFYGFFKQDQPHGLVRAWVCRSISCALRGGEEVLQRMCHAAGVHAGETTADGKLTLEFGECLGACEFAPCMLAGKTLYKNLTPELGEKFVAQCRAGSGQEPPEKEINGPIVAGGPAVTGSNAAIGISGAGGNGHQ